MTIFHDVTYAIVWNAASTTPEEHSGNAKIMGT